MKEFLANKTKELEKRMHESDFQIVKCKEEILVNYSIFYYLNSSIFKNLTANLKNSKELCENLTKEKNELENKIRFLSKEVKIFYS